MNPMNNNKHLAIIQDTIIITGSFLNTDLTDITVTFPTLIDDMDQMKAKVFWHARTSEYPEGGSPDVGGRLFWPDAPERDILVTSVKRSVSFACLTAMLPERNFVYKAMDAWRYDRESFLSGAYRMEVLQWLDASIIYPDQEEYDKAVDTGKPAPKPKLRSLAKAQSEIVQAIQARSINFLKDIYDKMKTELEED